MRTSTIVDDRVRRAVRPARGFRRAVLAQQPGRAAHEEPRSATRSRSRPARSWSRRSRCASATSSSPRTLREIAWPEDALPAGAFAKIADVLTGGKRVVLTAIEPNEPMLASKITGPGQRATLSAMLRDGLKAVTVRVNDVEGVGGFVLPGDRVDVVADAPDRQDQRHHRGRAAERPRAGDRSDRRRARRQAGGGQGGHARGRRRRRAEAVARGLGRQLCR